MNTIDYKDVFNIETLNIFTDASIKRYSQFNNFTVSVPGAIAVMTDINGNRYIIDMLYHNIPQSTNNDGEIHAVRLGILLALRNRFRGFKTINLFSDSNICIQGLKDYIYSWFNNRQGDILKSSSRKPACNQETFKNIVKDIVDNQLYINLFHQRGHVGEKCTLMDAIQDFRRTNGLNPTSQLMNILSEYNRHIDELTSPSLEDYNAEYYSKLTMVSGFNINNLNTGIMDQYRSYTKKEE